MRIPSVAAFVVLGLTGWGGAILAQQARPRPQAPVGAPAPGSAPARAPAPAPPGRIDFARQIQPILEAKCLECHSQTRRKGGLSLGAYDDILDGGKDGAIVRPGQGLGSLMVQRLSGEDQGEQMPKDDPPLPASEIALIRRWIDEGARVTPTAARAPTPWEAPMALTRPALPAAAWAGWDAPVDRLVASYLSRRGSARPALVTDAQYARRAYLDVWGLLPTPEQLQVFVADPSPAKRGALVLKLLQDRDAYAEHWMSFWNDLLRNEDGVTYFSETGGRKSITPWLLPALRDNVRYDEVVAKLIAPSQPGDPEGFVTGVNWRGETSAAVTPWMQASQNTAQVFLGVNLKCTACHDSFVNRWKLKDAYGLAAYFSPDPSLRMYRCDVAQDRYAGPGFIYPAISHAPRSESLVDRRAAAAAIFTDPRLGRMPRTIVNRVWQRLLGHGIVANPDEMDGEPWSPALLDWLASDFVANGYDLSHLIRTIVTSRAYQMRAVVRPGEAPERGYVFAGPEVRRLSAEQFADAVGAITGEWSLAPTTNNAATGLSGVAAREWRTPSTTLTRALGRPIRDQITSVRSAQPTTLQGLELANGAVLSRWVSRGARRLLGELPADPKSLFSQPVAGRKAVPAAFAIDVSRSTKLWLVVEEMGSNVPDAMLPAWADAVLEGPSGPTPLASLTPASAEGVRAGSGPVVVPGTSGGGVRVKNPSVLVYDLAGKGFTRFRGTVGLENPPDDIGATLNPATRFHIFDVPPDPERLVPPQPGAPLARPATMATIAAAIDRVYGHALGRAPTAAERRIAEAALRRPEGGDRPSPEGLADLLWAVLMSPEFQLLE